MYVYLPVQFIFSFCSNYCLLTFCIFLNIFLDLLYILCHAVFLAIKTNKKKKKKKRFPAFCFILSKRQKSAAFSPRTVIWHGFYKLGPLDRIHKRDQYQVELKISSSLV